MDGDNVGAAPLIDGVVLFHLPNNSECGCKDRVVMTESRVASAAEAVKAHVAKECVATYKEPAGMLRFPYLVPAGVCWFP